jgi:hypothetical protein
VLARLGMTRRSRRHPINRRSVEWHRLRFSVNRRSRVVWTGERNGWIESRQNSFCNQTRPDKTGDEEKRSQHLLHVDPFLSLLLSSLLFYVLFSSLIFLLKIVHAA